MTIEELKNKLKYSFSPYSHVQVACCAIEENGKEYWGVNTENAAFPSGLCAERSALFGSVAYGARVGNFKEIHIISNLSKLLYPCGACAQVISQFLKPDGDVYLYSFDLKQQKHYKMKDILPFAVASKDIVD